MCLEKDMRGRWLMKQAVKIIAFSGKLIVAAAALSAGILVVLFVCGNRFYIVRSGSMEPAVHTGDLVIVNSRYDYEKVAPGDIITYQAPNGALVTHRVVKVSSEGIETKGDANNLSDGISAGEENYLGRAWISVPKLGFVSSAALSKRGRILIITAAAAMVIISFFPGEDKKRRKGENKSENTA